MASWRVLEGGNLIYDGETFIGKMNTPVLTATVVRAVNHHDELVAALREAVVFLRDWKEPGVARLRHWGRLIDGINAEEAGGG